MSLPPAEDRSNSYFVVAVVKRNSSYAFTLDELRGKRSCHPDFGSPTGWDIPVGALVQRGFIRPRDCDVLTGTTPHRNTHVQALLGGSLGSGPFLRVEVLSQQDPREGSPREISSSSLTCPLLSGRLGNILSHTQDKGVWFCGGYQGPYLVTQSGIFLGVWGAGQVPGSHCPGSYAA